MELSFGTLCVQRILAKDRVLRMLVLIVSRPYTPNSGEGSNEWPVHMFEDEINSLSEPYLTANDGEPYPLYPNEVRDIFKM